MLRIDDMPQQVADDIHALRRDLLRPLALPAILWYNGIRKGGNNNETKQIKETNAIRLFIVTDSLFFSIIHRFCFSQCFGGYHQLPV